MWPKPSVPGSVFVTKETDPNPTIEQHGRVGYTVSPNSNFIMHFTEFRLPLTVRFSGMER